MFSPPTTPSTGMPVSSSSSTLSTTTSTTTTTPVPAPVTTAEKTHGIAIDEPSASFFFFFRLVPCVYDYFSLGGSSSHSVYSRCAHSKQSSDASREALR